MKTVLCIALVLVAGVCGVTMAGATFEYDGHGSHNWTSAGAWKNVPPGRVYPGDGGVKDDIVIIPWNLDDDKFPCEMNAANITVKRLVIEGKQRVSELIELKFPNDGEARVLTISPEQSYGLGPGEAALDLGDYATFEINRKGNLQLNGFAVVRGDPGTSAPVIKFIGHTEKPKLVIGSGGIASIEGHVDIFASGEGIDVMGEVTDPDEPEIFVLGSNCRMRGSFVIDPIMYQHGSMHTSPDGEGGSADAPGTIVLNCHPKAGGGHPEAAFDNANGGTIEVNGGSAEVRSEFVVNAPFAGSARLAIYRYGTMHVHQHFVMLLEDGFREDGKLMVYRGGEIRVDRGVLFEMQKADLLDCVPTDSPE